MRDRLRPSITNGLARQRNSENFDGTRDAAIIQPSLTGLVHALFATQHCVLGYYQAVPAGLTLQTAVAALGGRGMHIGPNGCEDDPAIIQQSRFATAGRGEERCNARNPRFVYR